MRSAFAVTAVLSGLRTLRTIDFLRVPPEGYAVDCKAAMKIMIPIKALFFAHVFGTGMLVLFDIKARKFMPSVLSAMTVLESSKTMLQTEIPSGDVERRQNGQRTGN
jgi:hypothetical protein